MPYFVEKHGLTWRLTYREHGHKPRNVAKDSAEARQLGLFSTMSVSEAKARSRQIKAEEWVKLEAKKAAKSKAILEKYKKLRSAFLTDEDAEEFEASYLGEYKIRRAHWNTMQKIIVRIEIHPSEWTKQKSKLYAQFERLKCSPNYAKKLLRYLNLWGYFVCDKQKRAWMKVPGLPGTWINKLEEKRESHGEALPLSPAMLEDKKSKIPVESYSWIYLSVWFGLRPEEVDQLLSVRGKLWDLQKDQEYGYVLAIFQTKLFKRGVPEDDCWKYIPTVFPEQTKAIELILSKQFKRPSGGGGKFMPDTFGVGYTHYSGRNNFSGLLRDAGYDQEARRHWMGHLDGRTTERYDRKTQRRKVFRPKKSA